MFRKDFKAKGQTQVKSSERKKLRQQLQEIYPTLNDELLSQIVPTGKGDDFTSCKLALATGDDVMLYSTNKTPWFFIQDDPETKKERILPTIYLLWKCPNLFKSKFRTHRQVFSKLLNGADLMLPGLIMPSGGVTLETFRHVKRDELCSICLDDNRYPIALAQTTMDGEDMYMSGMKGRGMIILHMYQDALWNFGPKLEVPYEREEMLQLEEPGEEEEEEEKKLDQATNTIKEDVELEGQPVSAVRRDHPESMDEILDTIFFYICQRKAKSYELPLLASHFSNLMQECVPGLTLDLKLSSHKKFSKFLQHQQEINGLIAVEETKPGVLAITAFHLHDNQILDQFRIPSWLKSYVNQMTTNAGATNMTTDSSENSTMKYVFPTITELWKSNSRVNDLFGCSTSTHYFRAEEVRQAVRSYVIKNQLNVDKQVKLDALLVRLFPKLDPSTTFVDWNELNQTVFNTMSPTSELVFAHLEQPIRINGHLQPIELESIERNRKRQTFIRHLDLYQIDLNDLCKRIRQGASVSAVIIDGEETKRQGRMIMAQGNQVNFVSRILKEEYHVPNKYIRDL